MARVAAGLDYEGALGRVMSLPDFERSKCSPGHSAFHLDRMSLILDRLGSPHLRVPTVHVAGTNGKGSTAAMVTSILTAAGHRVGLYTSPHLHRVVERIRVGLEPIDRQGFSDLVERIWPEVDWVGQDGGYGPLTFFELLTAMAFLHFSEIETDFQVIEVGLGGRLDATNLVSPEVCIITSISLDHVATLGNTVGEIALAKAGIIKSGVPVVVSPQCEEAMNVIGETASSRGAAVVDVENELSWRRGGSHSDGQSIEVDGLRGSYQTRLALNGDHQIENAATAIATVETLMDGGFQVSPESVVDGLRTVNWPARLQQVSGAEQVVVDGAHNPDSMRRLVSAVRQTFEFRRLFLVFGAGGGHLVTDMLAELADLSPALVAVRSRDPRATDSEHIADIAREQGLEVVGVSTTVAWGVREALALAGEGDLVLGTGSLFVAAEVIEELEGITPELYPEFERS